MTETSLLWLFLFLGLVTACLIAMTIAAIVIAGELHLTLRDARRTFRQGRRLLARANVATGHVEAVIHRACDAAADALGAVDRFKAHTQTLWTKRFGNGAGAEPRRHHRGR